MMNQKSNDAQEDLLRGRNVVDLAAYQDGAIVSRIVMKKKAGTVTMFAFAQGQELSEHKTPFDALVYMLDGCAEFVVGGRPRRLATGDALILPANVPHEVKAVERFKMLLIMVRSD